jgi:hypothetical protein
MHVELDGHETPTSEFVVAGGRGPERICQLFFAAVAGRRAA